MESASGRDTSDVGRCKRRLRPPGTFLVSRARSPLVKDCGRLGSGIGVFRALISCSLARSDSFLLFDFLRGKSSESFVRFAPSVGIVREALMTVNFSGWMLVCEAVVVACANGLGGGSSLPLCNSDSGCLDESGWEDVKGFLSNLSGIPACRGRAGTGGGGGSG